MKWLSVQKTVTTTFILGIVLLITKVDGGSTVVIQGKYY